jgi:hypothetical protein
MFPAHFERKSSSLTMECEDGSDMLGEFSQSSSRSPRNKAPQNQAPQDTVKQFWNQFNTKYPGKVFTILPDNPYARSKAALQLNGAIQSSAAVRSYEQATGECKLAVERIVKECERINQRYTDPHFDIEFDLKTGKRNCLDGLGEENVDLRPRGVRRVTVCLTLWIQEMDYKLIHVALGYLREPPILYQWPDSRRCAPGTRRRLLAHGCFVHHGK